MKPYSFTPTRTFDVDRYLDQQLALQKQAQQPEVIEHAPGIRSAVFEPKQMADIYRTYAANGKDFEGLTVERPFSFRAWAVRLNDRAERWLDRIDWMRFDIIAGNIGGFVLTAVVLYFGFVLIDAWLQGRFSLGAN
jgi:hypothetical protein